MVLRILTVLLPVALVLFGIPDHLREVVAPGAASGLTFQPAGDGVVTLAHESGDLTCSLEVTVQVAQRQAGQFAASLENGAVAVFTVPDTPVGPDEQSLLRLRIVKAASERSKFLWPSGETLTLRSNKGPFRIVDWEIYRHDQTLDNQTAARWRLVLSSFFAGLLGVILLTTIVVEWRKTTKEEGGAPFTAKEIVAGLIERIEVDDEAQEKRIRAFLHKAYVEEVPIGETLNSLDLATKAKRRTVLQQARGLLLPRLDNLIKSLAEERVKIARWKIEETPPGGERS